MRITPQFGLKGIRPAACSSLPCLHTLGPAGLAASFQSYSSGPSSLIPDQSTVASHEYRSPVQRLSQNSSLQKLDPTATHTFSSFHTGTCKHGKLQVPATSTKGSLVLGRGYGSYSPVRLCLREHKYYLSPHSDQEMLLPLRSRGKELNLLLCQPFSLQEQCSSWSEKWCIS